jgi:hypothetical protein
LFLFVFHTATTAHSTTLKAPDVVRQGKVYVIGISSEDAGEDTGGEAGVGEIVSVRGTFCKRNVYFNPTPYPGTYSGLLGVDMTEEAGKELLRVVIKRSDGTVELVDKEITVEKVDFGVQRIKVQNKWVDFDSGTMERIKLETEKMRGVLGEETEERLWSAPFMRPAAGRISTTFGLMRYINGKPKSPHCGIDIVAYLGTPVLCANSGRVALVIDAYIPGLTVIVDHGQGIYSLYCHLIRVTVTEGETVDQGDEIGLVGGTGRITGVHLHYSVFLNSGCVDPMAVEKIDVDDNGSIFISR